MLKDPSIDNTSPPDWQLTGDDPRPDESPEAHYLRLVREARAGLSHLPGWRGRLLRDALKSFCF